VAQFNLQSLGTLTCFAAIIALKAVGNPCGLCF